MSPVNCTNCQAPERGLWVSFGTHRQPKLTETERGNWTSLQLCEQCGALWCFVPYEPYASFPYLVRWPHDPITWRRVHDRDAGLTLSRWHSHMVRQHWQQLPPDELQQVEWHRQRSYGRNPIDEPDIFQTEDFSHEHKVA